MDTFFLLLFHVTWFLLLFLDPRCADQEIGHLSWVLRFWNKKSRWLQSILCSKVMRKLFPSSREISCMFLLAEGRQVTAGPMPLIVLTAAFPNQWTLAKGAPGVLTVATFCQ